MQPFGNSRRNRGRLMPAMSVENSMEKTNVEDVAWTRQNTGGMDVQRKQLGEAVDAEQLGCSLYR